MSNKAVRIWENHLELLMKIRSKSERNAMSFAMIFYGFYKKMPEDLKLNSNNSILFDAIKSNFIAKNQGGRNKQFINSSQTVDEKKQNTLQTVNKPLSDNIKHITDNIKKDNINVIKKKQNFIKPTFEEIDAYCREKNLSIDPQKFFDYFEAGNWIDAKGQKVKNWKQKLLTWQAHNQTPKPKQKMNDNQKTDWTAEELASVFGD